MQISEELIKQITNAVLSGMQLLLRSQLPLDLSPASPADNLCIFQKDLFKNSLVIKLDVEMKLQTSYNLFR